LTIVASVPTHLVEEAWRRGAARWIAGALEREPVKRHSLDDVLDALLSEKTALWIAFDKGNPADPIDAAMVSMILEFPQLREYHLPWCGGRKLWTWAREFDRLTDEAARKHGCAIKRCGRRAGWEPYGFRNVGVMLLKEVG
jgi:hypothetical protein